MREWSLTVEILEYWHAGSGRSRGPVVDSEPVKTPAGLPYLPGKTLRGLVREGVHQAEEAGHHAVPAGTVARLFGKPQQEGSLRFSDATLGKELEAWVATDPEARCEVLFRRLGMTAIEGRTGQAADETLRFVEVSIPVTLTARVHALGDPGGAEEALRAGLCFVRGLGSGRRRGLGRVAMKLGEVEV